MCLSIWYYRKQLYSYKLMMQSSYQHLDYITKYSYNLSSNITDVIYIFICPCLAKFGSHSLQNFFSQYIDIINCSILKNTKSLTHEFRKLFIFTYHPKLLSQFLLFCKMWFYRTPLPCYRILQNMHFYSKTSLKKPSVPISTIYDIENIISKLFSYRKCFQIVNFCLGIIFSKRFYCIILIF